MTSYDPSCFDLPPGFDGLVRIARRKTSTPGDRAAADYAVDVIADLRRLMLQYHRSDRQVFESTIYGQLRGILLRRSPYACWSDSSPSTEGTEDVLPAADASL